MRLYIIFWRVLYKSECSYIMLFNIDFRSFNLETNINNGGDDDDDDF